MVDLDQNIPLSIWRENEIITLIVGCHQDWSIYAGFGRGELQRLRMDLYALQNRKRKQLMMLALQTYSQMSQWRPGGFDVPAGSQVNSGQRPEPWKLSQISLPILICSEGAQGNVRPLSTRSLCHPSPRAT